MMAAFGEDFYKSVYDKAAAYLFFIARNRPFLDGNKRTASATAITFLRTNGKSPQYDVNDCIEFVVMVAEGKSDLNAASRYFKKICSKRLKFFSKTQSSIPRNSLATPT
jgi:death on curing protein